MTRKTHNNPMKPLILQGICKENKETQPNATSSNTESNENIPITCQMELLTEYFGFSPIDFVDDIINTVNDLLYKAMDELEKIISPEIQENELVEKVFIFF